MRVTEIPFSVLRFQYQLVRIPLQLIEDRFVSRLATEAPARLIYERSLGVLDATVGNALGDPRLERRGGALAARSGAVNGDHNAHRVSIIAPRPAIKSWYSGNDVAIMVMSSTVTGFSLARPMVRKLMAMR